MNIVDIVRLLDRANKQIVLPAMRNLAAVRTKADGSVVTEVDIACQDFIREGLARMDSSVGFLGEEMPVEEQEQCLQNGGTYWCLDPLDGTTNFATAFPAFATSLALIEGGRPVLAVTHDPARAESFYAVKDGGVWCNRKPVRTSAVSRLRDSVGFIDFKRLNRPLATRLAAEKHYRSQRNIGSCALEWAWLAAGRAQFIVHGGQKLWDYAAGSLMVAEAGGVCSDFSGNALFLRTRMASPILASANASLHRKLLRLVEAD